MRNPLRSEAEAFRFLIVVIVGAAIIIGLALANTWAGVAAAVLVVAGVGWWFLKTTPPEVEPPARPLASETPRGTHRVLVVAAPGTRSVAAPGATEVVVLVPALASTVEAFTGDVDDRRADAERTAAALAAQLPNARGEVGADNPALAVEDALRQFGADEIVVVGDDDGVLDAIRERVAVPVSRG